LSLYIDREYINKISFTLDLFKWVKSNEANFRCPLCGDSSKKASKKRGWFHLDSNRDSEKFFYKCFNCGANPPFHTFLKNYDSILYEEYLLDTFNRKGKPKRKVFKKAVAPFALKENGKPVRVVEHKSSVKPSIMDRFLRVCDLDDRHEAKQYVNNRKLPEYTHKILHYTEDWVDLVELIDPMLAKKSWHESRLLIPFYDQARELTYVQGRSFDPNAFLRYITLKVPDTEGRKLYGLDRCNQAKTVLVCEGGIDSLFLYNCVAVGDGSLLSCDFGDIYLPDIQMRNKEVVSTYKKIIEAGKEVVIWGSDWKYKGKDINDFIMNGASIQEIHEYIAKHKYKGLKAMLKLGEYQRI